MTPIVPVLEKDIERPAVKLARKNGWIVYKIRQSDPRGFPDRVFLLRETPTRRRRTVFIEFKRPGESPSHHQELAIEILRGAGNEVYVVECMEYFKTVLELQ